MQIEGWDRIRVKGIGFRVQVGLGSGVWGFKFIQCGSQWDKQSITSTNSLRFWGIG